MSRPRKEKRRIYTVKVSLDIDEYDVAYRLSSGQAISLAELFRFGVFGYPKPKGSEKALQKP
jgi:hypothetical protein